MIRVLVVDDSPSVRELLVHVLGSDPAIEIVGCAPDGEHAIRMTQEKRPDVITMDLQMPNMNGFEATRRIMEICPTPIVIVSGNADRDEVGTSFHAIEAGALMVVQRPLGPEHAEHHDNAKALIRTIKAMAEVKVVRRWPMSDRRRENVAGSKAALARRSAPKLVVIGASTGGPAVLREILTELPSDFPLPIVIVQHMSTGFLTGFAEWLSSTAHFPVVVADQDTHLEGGRAYLAPDGFQAGIAQDVRITFSRSKREHGMCPSVSYLFRSIPNDLCASTAAVLLTGMGKDGALELRRMKENGAVTIVQDRATSAVYGMPGEAIKQDAARIILSPPEIGKALRTFGQTGAAGFTFERG